MLTAQYLTSLRLDAALPAPLFRQLYDAIKGSILTGQISPGMQLPPTRALAELLNISRQTVVNAYSQLQSEGFLCGTVGKGTFVNEHLPITFKKIPEVSSSLLQPALRPLSSR